MITLQNAKPSRISLLRWMCWFLLANAVFFWLIGLCYLGWISPGNFAVGSKLNISLVWIFILITWFSHFALLAFFPALLLIPLILLVPKPRFIIPISCCAASIALIALVVDSIVFSQYKYHLNGVIWELLSSGGANELFNFTRLEIMVTAVGCTTILLLEIACATLIWKIRPYLEKLGQLKTILSILLISLFFSYLMFLLSAINEKYAGISQHPQAFPLYTLLLSKLLPMQNSLEAVETVGRNQLLQPAKNVEQLTYPLTPMQCGKNTQQLNVVLIVIDAWRFDMVDKAVTPGIYHFARNTWQFSNHHSGGNSTQSGIFSLFYAMPGSYWNSVLQAKQSPVLLRQFIKAGYQMGIFSSALLSLPAFDKTVFLGIPDLKLETPGDDALARDNYVTGEFVAFLNKAIKTDKPFFSFLFYDAAHSQCSIKNLIGPFQPAAKECNRTSLTKKTDPRPMFNRYKNALLQVDRNVTSVLATLKNKGLLDKTIIIITGDHGEEFNDNSLGYWGHAGNFTHYQTQTPLLIYWPKQRPTIYTHTTTHYDIAPTLLQKLFRCNNPTSDYSYGKSLFNLEKPHYILINSYINYGIVAQDRITTIYPTGNYKIDDIQGKPLTNEPLNIPLLKRVFKDLRRFYREDKKI